MLEQRSENGGVAMTCRRPLGGTSVARIRAATFAVLALLAVGSPAAAVIVITGGPTTSPGSGWACTAPTNTASPDPEKSGTGSNYTCSGTAYSSSTISNLYIGINKSTASPFGEKMNSSGGSEPTTAELFSWSTNPATNQIR